MYQKLPIQNRQHNEKKEDLLRIDEECTTKGTITKFASVPDPFEVSFENGFIIRITL